MNLTKPAQTAAAAGTTTSPAVDTAVTISVNVGVPGNIKKVVLELGRANVSEALAAAGLSANGYDIRVAGEPVSLNSPVRDGQTVLLLRPVRGNVDIGKPADVAGITVNVGVPGNIKKVVLGGAQRHTVGEALSAAGLSANGYDVRVAGNPVTLDSPVTDGQTVLLLRPVRGN
jgi:hypothetical protein